MRGHTKFLKGFEKVEWGKTFRPITEGCFQIVPFSYPCVFK